MTGQGILVQASSRYFFIIIVLQLTFYQACHAIRVRHAGRRRRLPRQHGGRQPAGIVDYYRDARGYEVDISHEGRSKEILFDSSYEWMRTSTDLSRNVPDLVRQIVETQYPGKRTDDCDYIETAQGENHYMVALDNHNLELKTSEDGRVTKIPDR